MGQITKVLQYGAIAFLVLTGFCIVFGAVLYAIFGEQEDSELRRSGSPGDDTTTWM